MSTTVIKPWVESVILHPDVVSPSFSEDIFALDLGPLADGNKNVPAVYRDPEQFFRASYVTSGLQSLLLDVLSRLSGGTGNRVLKLITPFGGGKSHTLASLFHAANNRKALDSIPEGKALPRIGKVRTAVFDGQFFSPSDGKEIPGGQGKANTRCGWVAWSLAGAAGYELFRRDDEGRVSPGADNIVKLLGDDANLILLDEVLEYLISAGGIKVLDTTLRDETLSFIKRLTVAAGRKNCIRIEIYGSKKSAWWCSENPELLHYGHRDTANEAAVRGTPAFGPDAAPYIDHPPGHVEGFPDTFKMLFRAVYGAIAGATPERLLATAEHGHQEAAVCEAILNSHQTKTWVKVRSARPRNGPLERGAC
jgi:hypothetical protein